MGKIERDGYGEGMTEQEARMNWLQGLTEDFGSSGYTGGGTDLDEVTNVVQKRKPVPAQRPTKVKIIKTDQGEGKWINGYVVVEEVPLHQLTRDIIPNEVLAETLAEAKQIATNITLKTSGKCRIVPTRLFKTSKNRLLEEASLFTTKPIGGKEAVPGLWYFEGLFRY
jgi:hypothetical protein